MDADQLIQSAGFDGVRLALTPEGKLHYSGDSTVVAEWLPILREHKAEIVEELHRARRLAKVLAMLGDRKYAVLVENDRTDPVIATVTIRGVATFEMAIPRHSYDGLVLLELLEQQSPCDAIPSPEENKRNHAHPGRAA